MLLPPGDWDRANLLPVGQLIEMKKRQNIRNEASSENVEKSAQNKITAIKTSRRLFHECYSLDPQFGNNVYILRIQIDPLGTPERNHISQIDNILLEMVENTNIIV